jgi:hypothetical protein
VLPEARCAGFPNRFLLNHGETGGAEPVRPCAAVAFVVDGNLSEQKRKCKCHDLKASGAAHSAELGDGMDAIQRSMASGHPRDHFGPLLSSLKIVGCFL